MVFCTHQERTNKSLTCSGVTHPIHRCRHLDSPCTEVQLDLVEDGKPLPVCNGCDFRSIQGYASPTELYPCIYRGGQVDTDVKSPCEGGPQPIFACGIHGRCSPRKYCSQQPDRACSRCSDRTEKLIQLDDRKVSTMKWAYGVTTVKSRLENGLLERTLNSLAAAGFDKPRLFIDGDNSGFERFGLEMTHRAQQIRTFGNWYLGLQELTIRDPSAERYAMFQDDFITYRGLKDYLSRIEYPKDGYMNLYTFPHNQARSGDRLGFYESDQMGKGAVALVFSNEAARLLLRQQHMVDRPMDPLRGHKAIDGGIVDAFRKIGWKEYVHNPSLVQHTGAVSSMGNSQHALAISFKGEEWDVREMLKVI